MPKLYFYFGLMVFFYSNEHEPIHVHGFYQGREGKAELTVRNGKVVRITFTPSRQDAAIAVGGTGSLQETGARQGRRDCAKVD